MSMVCSLVAVVLHAVSASVMCAVPWPSAAEGMRAHSLIFLAPVSQLQSLPLLGADDVCLCPRRLIMSPCTLAMPWPWPRAARGQVLASSPVAPAFEAT
eukprot:UN4272